MLKTFLSFAALLLLAGTLYAQEPAGAGPAPTSEATGPAGETTGPAGEITAPASETIVSAGETTASLNEATAAVDEERTMSGMSILGNQEAPKSLVIVPWKSSEIGAGIGVSRALDTAIRPVDKDVFLRELEYYEIRAGGAD